MHHSFDHRSEQDAARTPFLAMWAGLKELLLVLNVEECCSASAWACMDIGAVCTYKGMKQGGTGVAVHLAKKHYFNRMPP